MKKWFEKLEWFVLMVFIDLFTVVTLTIQLVNLYTDCIRIETPLLIILNGLLQLGVWYAVKKSKEIQIKAWLTWMLRSVPLIFTSYIVFDSIYNEYQLAIHHGNLFVGLLQLLIILVLTFIPLLTGIYRRQSAA